MSYLHVHPCCDILPCHRRRCRRKVLAAHPTDGPTFPREPGPHRTSASQALWTIPREPRIPVQLGVEFGSKLITIPEENKVVKLQCTRTVQPLSPLTSLLNVYLQAGTPQGRNLSAPSRVRITVAPLDACWSMMSPVDKVSPITFARKIREACAAERLRREQRSLTPQHVTRHTRYTAPNSWLAACMHAYVPT